MQQRAQASGVASSSSPESVQAQQDTSPKDAVFCFPLIDGESILFPPVFFYFYAQRAEAGRRLGRWIRGGKSGEAGNGSAEMSLPSNHGRDMGTLVSAAQPGDIGARGRFLEALNFLQVTFSPRN